MTQPAPGGRFSSTAAFVLAIIVTAGLTAALYARTALDPDTPARPALTVEAARYELQDTYRRQVSYLGRVVAGRKADLGFEVTGQIARMPVREGMPVTAGDLIASLDDSAAQARRQATAAELKQTEAELELARLKEKRQSELRQSGAVSKEAYDETRLRAEALAAQLDAVAARLGGIDIELAKSQLLAPYDGVIANRYTYQGAVVGPGMPVVRLIETARREAHVGIPAERAGSMRPHTTYSLQLRDRQVDAALLAVRPDVEPLTRTTDAVFALPEGLAALDGEPVTLWLEETVAMAGGWLPVGALLEGQRGVWTVLRLEAEDSGLYRTRREAVEVLELQGDQAFVRGTLDDRALVVASGVHRITPGTTVTLAGAR